MNKKERTYPWYIYNNHEVVLMEGSQFEGIEKYAIENCGDIYAIPISTAEQLGWKLSLDTCNPTFLLSYQSGDYRTYDSGEEIEIQTIRNPENEEHEIDVWEVKNLYYRKSKLSTHWN